MSGIGREYQGRIVIKRYNIHNADTRPMQEKYGFTATPEFFLVNGDGAVLAHWDGELNVKTLRPLLDKYLAAAIP